ncbi:serine endopeptidase [Thozetella sp. PMI_491]|nr:serine endopeptidase [Thozetella sp. PMI_491]
MYPEICQVSASRSDNLDALKLTAHWRAMSHLKWQMRVIIPSIVATFGCAVLAQDAANATYDSTIAPKRYIIEATSEAGLADLKAKLASFSATTILKTFDSTVFTGVSVESEDGNIDSLLAISPAASVWPSKKIQLSLNAPAQTYASAAATANYSIHSMTGVDKLHAAGIFGKGAKIASIDTGVQYTHPAFGGCFGEGCRIAGGYDLVGDGCWPVIGCRKVPDDDPFDAIGLGTLIAGVISGVDETNGYYGVAPGASLYSYKVFTAQGETDEDTLIEAFLKAYEDGADVITCGLGSLGGYSNAAWATVASRIVDEGVVVVVSMGDNGSEGPYFAGNVASGRKVLSVASVESNVNAAPGFEATFNVDGSSSTAEIGYVYTLNPFPYTLDGYPIVPLSMDPNVTDDACTTVNTTLFNTFSKAVGLVRLGGCTPRVKQTNLINAGVRNIMFYYDGPGIEAPTVSRIGSFVITVEAAAGEAIIDAWAAGGNVTGKFSTGSTPRWVGLPDAAAGLPNYEGSWGPLNDLSIKPDVAGPGGYIFTTYPTNDWVVYTGTELAAAYIAGVAGLYIGQYGGRNSNPNFNATALTMRLMSSGSSVPYFDAVTGAVGPLNAPVAQVGTGLINAFKVLNYSTSLSYAKFELNDTRYFERYHSVDITNNAKSDVTYTFAVLPGAGFETWNAAQVRPVKLTELTAIEIVPSVSLPSGTFKVSAGATKTAKINFDAPSYSQNLPLYGGNIQINSSLGESFSVPYLGLGANLNAALQTQFPTGYPYIVSGVQKLDISLHSNFTFDLSLKAQDFPKLYSRTLWGAVELRWDIFESTWAEKNWAYPPVVGANGYVGSATYWAYSASSLVYDPAVAAYASNTTAFPITGLYRSSVNVVDQTYWWLGGLADGSQIKPGKYIMRVAALIPFGNPAKSNGWNAWTVPFTVA